MKKNISIGIYIFFILMFFYTETFPWSKETHIMISFKTNLYFTKLKDLSFVLKLNFDKGVMDQQLFDDDISKSIMDWITFGSDKEDDSFDPLGLIGARSDNHFHNPLKTFSDAGLSDIKTGESLLLWAQDGNKQKTYVQSDNSWSKLREYFFNALTSTENTIRQSFFVKTFKGLGHQIHLIQDSDVPDHVRNDSHPLNNFAFTNKKYGSFRCIESWAESNLTLINDFTQVPLFPQVYFDHLGENNLVPIFHLVDYGVYNGTNPSKNMEQGLAEYTNANFVSEDTILTEGNNPDSLHYFPYPKYASTNLNSLNMPYIITAADGKQDYVTYLKKDKDGEIIEHFLKAGYMEKALRPNADQPPTEIYMRTFFLDELCHKDYASMLVPRAVGYSAALIDYFFRGELEISLPEEEGIYGFAPYPEEGFKKITLMVKNVTQNENMVNGKLSLVVRYRNFSAGGEFNELDLPRPEEEQKFIMVDYKDPVTNSAIVNLNSGEQKKFTFDLSQPLPVNVADVTLTVVFKGDLGAEMTDAVAIGFKDISEPTVIEVYNDTDKVCFNGSVVDYMDPALLNYADQSHDGVINNNDVDIIPRTVRLGDVLFRKDMLVDKTTNTYFNFIKNRDTLIEPGNSHRMYVLADEDKPFFFSFLIGNKRIENSQVPYTPPWTLPYRYCKYVFSDFQFWIYNQHITVDPIQLAPRVNKLIWNPTTQKFDHFNFPNYRWTAKNKYFWNLFYYSQPDSPNPCTCTGCDVYKPTPAMEFKAFHYPSVVIVDYFDAQ